MTKQSKCRLLLCLALSCICVPLAWSRPWNPAPDELAADYAIITHNKGVDKDGNASMTVIMWLVPQRFPENSPLRQTFEKYVVIGVAHGHIARSTGVTTFDKTDTLQPGDGNGNPMKRLTGNNIPPTLAGAMAAMDGIFRQSLGAFGQGITWFVFDPGAIRPCGAGRLIIPYADENYTYELPLPGCPK